MSDESSTSSSETEAESEKLGCAPALLILALSLVTIPLSVILNGVVLALLWRWFMEPLGLPAISAGHALGIATLVTFMVVPMDLRKLMEEHKKTLAENKAKTTKQLWGFMAESYGLLALKYLSIVGMALIYRHYM